MKITIRLGKTGLGWGEDDQMERMFRAAHLAARMWNGEVKGMLPDELQEFVQTLPYEGEGDYPDIKYSDTAVTYTTASGKGEYTITPNSITFDGWRNSLIGGCPMSRMRLIGKDNDNVTLSTLERIDVSIYAPIGVGSGTTLFYGELGSYQGYTWTIETSEPDKPLEAW